MTDIFFRIMNNHKKQKDCSSYNLNLLKYKKILMILTLYLLLSNTNCENNINNSLNTKEVVSEQWEGIKYILL